MEDRNVEVVRQLFEQFGERGIEGAIETMDEDIVIEIPPELSAEPDHYRGHDGARRYFEGFVVHELANGRIMRIRPYADLEGAQAAIG